ncbi:hypothetical protein CDD82_7132 [Ophiocordyceps australis]|uniref:Uncharacterized protein n=1 Tax=Ophiocordyceps australis TaxID=1399860 RepID=A0A2C5ZW12_9HYPO|nr:hypothetical protein CDD82_7132 [Ophiocordyceps australis]
MPLPAQDGSSKEPVQALPAATSVMRISKTRHSSPPAEPLPTSQQEASLPFRRSNPSAASLYASTLSPPDSRPMSPVGRAAPFHGRTIFDNFTRDASNSTGNEKVDEPLGLILQSFVPRVAVYASKDTEALMTEKGLRHGLWELLRPFGEAVQGKVTVRDSNGVSRTFDDFAIRFTNLDRDVEYAASASRPQTLNSAVGQKEDPESATKDRKILADIETVIDLHLSFGERSLADMSAPVHQDSGNRATSPYYALYLRRLLSATPLAPQESFAHPVACVIAISSRTENPIEELGKLYLDTSQGPKKFPPWVNGEYLRYYVLVHDEDKDDISASVNLFEQMKRNLGLHCHLLRLRCSQSAETDDDSIPLPRSDWIYAAEELVELNGNANTEEPEDSTRRIFESDATAIRTFVREMVTQSIVPTMERHVSVWNDQVASRRRGLTGRFMSLSRKWTGFGGGSRSSSGPGGNPREGYELLGYYRADTPEATMRKLADYAFMLRDWKLAQLTYDLLRSDFGESKAWKYHAAVNEMAATSLLLISQALTSKLRAETVDQMLESALYSYGTRCSSPYGAVRSILLGLELLRLRGGSSADDASRWGLRLLESKLLGRVGDALVKERLAVCYASKAGVGKRGWGSRHRKSAAWSTLAADAWCQQAKYVAAKRCIGEAQRSYQLPSDSRGIRGFTFAVEYMESLEEELANKLGLANDQDRNNGNEPIEQDSETLTDGGVQRANIKAGDNTMEIAPLHGHGARG